MLSYLDMFTAASIASLDSVCGRLEEGGAEMGPIVDSLAPYNVPAEILSKLEAFGKTEYEVRQDTWNSVQDVVGLLHSVGKTVQSCVKNSVDVIASSMLTRRDAWLEKIKEVLPKEQLLELRVAILN